MNLCVSAVSYSLLGVVQHELGLYVEMFNVLISQCHFQLH